MRQGDSPPPGKIKKLDSIDEVEGKLGFEEIDDKLMHSVLDNDQEKIEEGKLIEDALNAGFGGFTPDIMLDNLIKDYALAENIYGEKIIRALFGYDPDYIERNVRIPEFQRMLKEKLEKNLKQLQQDRLVDHRFNITEKGFELASLVLFVKELDTIRPLGIRGERVNKKVAHYGEKEEIKPFKKGDRYRDIAIKSSIKAAIRRGHASLDPSDLRSFARKSRGQSVIVYAVDASGSMRGDKIEACKKAAIALSYKAVTNKDKVGIIVFGEDVTSAVEPTLDFAHLLQEIVRIKATSQTDIASSVRRASEMFPAENVTKHVMLLTDALPTSGKEPEEDTLKEIGIARNRGITISIIGIRLDKKGKEFARKVAEQGGGRLYAIDDLDEMRVTVLEDYGRVG